MNKINLIINADDFGFSKSINKGVIDAYNSGLISSTSMMMNMPYVEDAVDLYKNIENNNLGLGVHLNLTVGKPLSIDVPSLVDNDGNFYNHKLIENGSVIFKYEDVYKELKKQIDTLLSYGLEIDHLDFHHFIDKNDTVFKALVSLSLEYNVCTRVENYCKDKAEKNNLISAEGFFDVFFDNKALSSTIENYVKKNSNKSSIEIMTHVGYIDDDTKNRTGYINRENEIKELKKLKDNGFYNNINLINYKQLKQLEGR